MCDPFSLAIAATAVGTGLQYRAQQQRESEMRGLQRVETERQDRLFNESKQLFDKNRGEYERPDVDAKMAEAASARQQQYAQADANAPRANEALPGSTGGNVVVLEAFRQAAEAAKQRAAQQGASRAELASFGDFMGDAAITTGRRSGDIGMLGSFSQGSANILPLELQSAATRQRGAATIGNLLVGLGTAGLGAAPDAGMFGRIFTRSPVRPTTVGTTMTGRQASNLFGNIA